MLSFWFVLMKRHLIVLVLKEEAEVWGGEGDLEKVGWGRNEGQRQQDYLCHQRASAHIRAARRAHIPPYLLFRSLKIIPYAFPICHTVLTLTFSNQFFNYKSNTCI